MRLALAVGEPDWRGLLGTMTSRQLDEWAAYFELLDEEEAEMLMAQHDADNHRAGTITAMVGNCHRRKGTKAFEPSTFFPRRPRPDDAEQENPSTDGALKALFESLADKGE